MATRSVRPPLARIAYRINRSSIPTFFRIQVLRWNSNLAGVAFHTRFMGRRRSRRRFLHSRWPQALVLRIVFPAQKHKNWNTNER